MHPQGPNFPTPTHVIVPARTQLFFETDNRLVIPAGAQGAQTKKVASASHHATFPMVIAGVQRRAQYRLGAISSQVEVEASGPVDLSFEVQLLAQLNSTAVIDAAASQLFYAAGTAVVDLPYVATPALVANALSARLKVQATNYAAPLEISFKWLGTLACAEPIMPQLIGHQQ